MSKTIEIQDQLFCDMIFSLFNDVDIEKQVKWLQLYGANFYSLQLYQLVNDTHAISVEDFTKITTAFWDNEVQYKTFIWAELKEIIGVNFYESYLGFSFNNKQSVTDIHYTLEDYNANKANRYYSPALFKCIAALLELENEAVFSFTKANMPNNEISIVFKVTSGTKVFYYNISQVPV